MSSAESKMDILYAIEDNFCSVENGDLVEYMCHFSTDLMIILTGEEINVMCLVKYEWQVDKLFKSIILNHLSLIEFSTVVFLILYGVYVRECSSDIPKA